jgi:protein-tyrosine phosphatase
VWKRVEKPVDDVEKLMRRNGWLFRAMPPVLAVVLAVLTFTLQAQNPPAASGAAITPAPSAPPLSSHSVEGIKNFGQVTPRLYRGAQPAEKGFELLRMMGVDIIVDFRNEKDLIERERQAVEARHISFVSIPWSPFHDPTTEQVRQFFQILREHPDKRIFVHCEAGADRAGTMVALYRIAAQGWTVEDAVREMKAYHLHDFWFPHLARYVRKFPQQLEFDPVLRGEAPSAPAPQPTTP